MSPMQQFANPARFLKLARAILVPVWIMATVAFAMGLYMSFVTAPPDYQQGETVRIMFVHVPAAWMALMIYTAMARGQRDRPSIFRHPLADMAAKAAAPIGAMFCLLALITGSLWGKPMWGAWWVWDARLTSMFVLFLLYLGYMAIWQAIEDPHRAALVARIVAIAGFINVPIVKFSVDWWNSLHQRRIRAAHGRADDRFTHAMATAGDGVCLSAPLRGPAPRRHAKRDHIAQDPATAVRASSRDADGSRRCPCRFCDRSLCGELCGPCGAGVLHPAARPKAPAASGRSRARQSARAMTSAPLQPRPGAWLAVLPVAIFLVLAALFFRGLSGDPAEVPSVLINKPVPDFVLAPVQNLNAARSLHHRSEERGPSRCQCLGVLVRALPDGASLAHGPCQA